MEQQRKSTNSNRERESRKVGMGKKERERTVRDEVQEREREERDREERDKEERDRERPRTMTPCVAGRKRIIGMGDERESAHRNAEWSCK